MSAAGSCPKQSRPEDWRELVEGLWQASVKAQKGQSGIPIFYGLDAIHGNANVVGATVFPHNIGIGASPHAQTVEDLARVTGDEVRAIGANWIFGPNLAVAKHYHWGRTFESVSGNPLQVSEFARQYLTSLNQHRTEFPILACVKHWVGDGGTAQGIEQGDTRLSWPELEREHVRPFSAAIDAGALSVMVSFSSWNGDKCHAHDFLINEVLKSRLEFQGFVVSDMQGVNYVDDDLYSAIGSSVNAGIDMFMVPENWRTFQDVLTRHVELGTVSMTRINDAVERIVMVKEALGLFNRPAPFEASQPYVDRFGSREHRKKAEDAVRRSLVLLKNSPGVLPLREEGRLLVAGDKADHAGIQCGGFTQQWQGMGESDYLPGVTTLWQGVLARFPQATRLQDDQIESANLTASDTVLVVIGERPYAEGLGDIRSDDSVLMHEGVMVDGELAINPAYGQSLKLADLHPEDLALLRTLRGTGCKVVAVLICGRPLIIDDELALCDTLVAAWLPGSEGHGLAQVLAGDVSFSGQLGFDWPTLDASVQSHGATCDGLYGKRWAVGYRWQVNTGS